MNSFGERLKNLRKSRGYSQAYLAESIGVSPQSVSNWECDNTMPDIFQIVPLAFILNVSTDYLLGVGTDEQTDCRKLDAEVSYIWANYSVNHMKNNADYMVYEAYCAFLRKYPLNYEIKYKCALAINDYLLVAAVRKKFNISEKEFDRLYSESEKMLQSVCDHAVLPQLLIDAKTALVDLYLLKNKFSEAESVAQTLPDVSGIKENAFRLIAQRKGDSVLAMSAAEQVCKARQFAYAEALFYRAYCLEKANASNCEVINAWEELEHFSEQMIEQYQDLSGLTVNAYERNPYCYLITAYVSRCNMHLKENELPQALDCMKKATAVAIKMIAVAREQIVSTEVMADIVYFAKHTPQWCYKWAYSNDNNPLTQEPEYERCVLQINSYL